MTLLKYQQPLIQTFYITNMPASPTLTTSGMGTTVTTGATPHAETGWTTIFTAAQITRDIHELHISIIDTGASAAQTDCMVDFAVGEAGSEVAFVSNYLAGYNPNGSPEESTRRRIRIAKGQRISVRARSLQTAKAVNVVLHAMGYDRMPEDCARGIDIIGANSASSQGTSVPSGNAPAWGSWTNIGSTTARVYRAVRPLVQGSLNATTTSQAYFFQLGSGSAAFSNSLTWRFAMTSAELGLGPYPDAFHRRTIPIGTQLQIRGMGSGTAQALDCAIEALY
jgi:hypothetical protein